MQNIHYKNSALGLFNTTVKRYAQLDSDMFVIAVVGHIYPVADVVNVFVYKGTEQPVPKGKHVSKITVGPRKLIMVVKLMHVRCHYQIAKGPVQSVG